MMFENVHYMTLLEEGTPKSTEYAEKATFPICKKSRGQDEWIPEGKVRQPLK